MILAISPLDFAAVLVVLGTIIGMGAVTFRALALLGMMAGIPSTWRGRGWLLLGWAAAYLVLTMLLNGPELLNDLTTDVPPRPVAVLLEGIRAGWLWTLFSILDVLAKGRLEQ